MVSVLFSTDYCSVSYIDEQKNESWIIPDFVLVLSMGTET